MGLLGSILGAPGQKGLAKGLLKSEFCSRWRIGSGLMLTLTVISPSGARLHSITQGEGGQAEEQKDLGTWYLGLESAPQSRRDEERMIGVRGSDLRAYLTYTGGRPSTIPECECVPITEGERNASYHKARLLAPLLRGRVWG